VFFAQPVGEDAKEQGKDAEEAEAQRNAEKLLCFLWRFCAFCVFQSVKICVNRGFFLRNLRNLWFRWMLKSAVNHSVHKR